MGKVTRLYTLNRPARGQRDDSFQRLHYFHTSNR
jgi:hypothetical protein